MSDADRELVLAVTTSLRDLNDDGAYPSHEEIESELARRVREALGMYIEAKEALVKSERLADEYKHRLVACGAW